jgi:hypothetical protein
MHVAGSRSWRFEHDDGYMLHEALFVRDATLLPVAGSAEVPPPLAGEVPDVSAAVPAARRAMAARQWLSWWQQILDEVVREVAIRRAEDPGQDALARLEARTRGRRELCDPPGFLSLSAAPELQSAAVATLSAYRAWSAVAGRPRGPEREIFAWPLVRDAAHDVAASLGVPVGEMDAVAHVIDVQGRWAYVVGGGCGFCSTAVAADPATASELLRELFASGAQAGS